jgi:hypothetical protein
VKKEHVPICKYLHFVKAAILGTSYVHYHLRNTDYITYRRTGSSNETKNNKYLLLDEFELENI